MACVLAVAMIAGVCFLPAGNREGENGQTKNEHEALETAEQVKLKEQASIVQIMHFTRCMHRVDRRIQVPEHLAGSNLEALQAYYDNWQIIRMNQDEVEMERHIDLFCPMHIVVSLDLAGQVVLAENRYGDGMAILDILEDARVKEKDKPALIAGIGFESREDAVAWLKSQGIIK